MQVNNLTSGMGTVVGWSDTMIKNISFTSAQWASFANEVNRSNSDAFYAGLIIGSLAGMVGVLLAVKFMEWREKRGKS